MKTRILHGFAAAILTVFTMLVCVFPSHASDLLANGRLELNGNVINGWAVDAKNPDKSASVVIYCYTDGTMEAKELARVTANQYRDNVSDAAGNGSHSFSYNVDWNKMDGTSFVLEAFVETKEGPKRLYGSPKMSKAVPQTNAKGPVTGPGAAAESGVKGDLIGQFEATAYCTCSKCCPTGHTLTSSGTVPTANHTISADTDVFPYGTKLMIDGIIYTVEDTGSSIQNNRLDIFFPSHQEALDFGRKTVDVYSVK